jgi:hypothetical protein
MHARYAAPEMHEHAHAREHADAQVPLKPDKSERASASKSVGLPIKVVSALLLLWGVGCAQHVERSTAGAT